MAEIPDLWSNFVPRSYKRLIHVTSSKKLLLFLGPGVWSVDTPCKFSGKLHVAEATLDEIKALSRNPGNRKYLRPSGALSVQYGNIHRTTLMFLWASGSSLAQAERSTS